MTQQRSLLNTSAHARAALMLTNTQMIAPYGTVRRTDRSVAARPAVQRPPLSTRLVCSLCTSQSTFRSARIDRMFAAFSTTACCL